MTASRRQRAIAVLCVASLVLTSCTSLQAVSIPSGASPRKGATITLAVLTAFLLVIAYDTAHLFDE